MLLNQRHLLGADLDAEVAARDHDAVRHVDDLLEPLHRFGALDLGDDRSATIVTRGQLHRLAHVQLAARGQLVTPHVSAWEIALLISSGVVTAVPLVWFAEGARRLSLSTLGIMQYIAPTLQFLCAVVLYGEALTRAHVVAFACIWTAVALYTGDGVRRHVRAQPA